MSTNSDLILPMVTTIETDYSPPIVVVGTVSLDILHFWDASHTITTGIQIDIGGVCKHVACVLGALGENPCFVSTQYTGELGQTLGNLLSTNHVNWQPLIEQAPFSLFEAHIDTADNVFTELFVEGDSLTLLTPEVIRRHPMIAKANILVGCTNLSVASMHEMVALAQSNDSRFWLLTSSNLEVPRIRQLFDQLQPSRSNTANQSNMIDLLSLNHQELQLLVNRTLETLPEIANAAATITESVGHCLVTLGSRGAMLAEHGLPYVHYQGVAPINGRSPVGGGDVMFASLLAAKLQSQSWTEALAAAAFCTRLYLLRDKNSPTPYASLRVKQADSSAILPPIEKVFVNHAR